MFLAASHAPMPATISRTRSPSTPGLLPWRTMAVPLPRWRCSRTVPRSIRRTTRSRPSVRPAASVARQPRAPATPPVCVCRWRPRFGRVASMGERLSQPTSDRRTHCLGPSNLPRRDRDAAGRIRADRQIVRDRCGAEKPHRRDNLLPREHRLAPRCQWGTLTQTLTRNRAAHRDQSLGYEERSRSVLVPHRARNL